MKNRRKAVQPFEIKKRKIDISRNYEANGFEKNQRKFENFSTLISKKSSNSIDYSLRHCAIAKSLDPSFQFELACVDRRLQTVSVIDDIQQIGAVFFAHVLD